MDRVAVYSASRNLYKDAIPAIKSMFLNGKPDKVYFLIEDDEFPEWLPPQVQTINVSNQPYFTAKSPNYNTKFTVMAIMRAVLAKVLPDEDRILSMDCDAFVIGDITELWEHDIGDFYVSASREPYLCRWEKVYYNTGVSIHNLKAIREDKIDDQMIWLISTMPLNCVEQDAINIVCEGNILDMPSEYNYNNYTAKPRNPVAIKHYAGYDTNQWSTFPDVMEFKRMDWRDIMARYENR